MIDVLREMGMASRALDAMANAEFKKLDLARGQFVYLVRIYEHPGIIARDLAKLILMDKTTIARAVAKLEKNGLIVRRSDPANHRIKRMYVTKKGAELYPFIIRENEHSNEVALQGFSPQEAQQAHDYLQRMRQNLEKDWDFVKTGGQRNY